MTDFDLSGLRPPQLDPPPPPIDPATARQQRIVDDTRVAEAVTRFIADKQDVLFNQPDAFYRSQGADAIHAAPVVTKRLLDMKDAALDGTDNDYQRRKLGVALEAHMVLTRDGIARHVADQSLVWQRQTALDRIDLLAKEAALHHTYDDNTIGAISEAAANAARAHARVGDVQPAPEAEDQASAAARSRILASTIQARLDAGNIDGAARLYGKVQTQLGEGPAQSLDAQIQTAQRRTAARAYTVQVAPVGPITVHEEADGWHADATAQNQRDHADDPEQQATVQHQLDVDHAQAKKAIDDRNATLDKTVADWIATPRADGAPQTDLPAPMVWNQLDDVRRAQMLEGLRRNQRPPEIPVDQNATTSVDSTAKKLATAMAPAIRVSTPDFAIGGELASAAGRVAPLVKGGGLLTAAGILLVPQNFQGGTIDVGDGVQARWAPGQRSAAIEHRVDDGLFGTGLGAKWEQLPVPATYEAGPDGRPTLRYDAVALERVLAARRDAARDLVAFGMLPASTPAIYEARIAEKAKGRIKTKLYEATDEEITALCPNYPKYQKIALRGAMMARVEGLRNGLDYGKFVHKFAENAIKKSKEQLEEQGIVEVAPELALLRGKKVSFFTRGHSRLDVIEVYENERKACVYDFKTGGARMSDATKLRYAEEGRLYANVLIGGKYIQVIVIPVHVR
jgi:hypothetical protein